MKKLLSITLALAVTLTLFVGLGVFAGTGDDTTQASGNDVISYSVEFHKPATDDPAKGAFSYPGMTGKLNYTPAAGDVLEYDVKVVSKLDNVALGNLNINYGKQRENAEHQMVDTYAGEMKDVPGIVGKYDNRTLQGNVDMTVFADNEWYHREVSLDPMVNNDDPANLWYMGPQASQIDATQAANGTTIVYFDNIRITNNGAVKKVIYADSTDFDTFEINVGNTSDSIGDWGPPDWIGEVKIEQAKDDVVYPSLAKDGDYIELELTQRAQGFSTYRLGDLNGAGYVPEEGDYLEYDVRLLSDTTAFGGVDMDGFDRNGVVPGPLYYRDMPGSDGLDDSHIPAHPGGNLTSIALNKWYTRKLGIPTTRTVGDQTAALGFDAFYLATDMTGHALPSGHAKVLYDNIVIKAADGTEKLVIFKEYDNRLNNQDHLNRCEGKNTNMELAMTFVQEKTIEVGETSTLTARELDEAGNAIVYEMNGDAQNGSVAITGNSIVYTPNEGFTGRDEFRVKSSYNPAGYSYGAEFPFLNWIQIKNIVTVTPKAETTTTAPAETTTTAPAETTTTAPAETTTTAPAETTTTAPAETTTTAPAETTTTAPVETTTVATTETTTAPTVEKKKIDYIQLDVNTKKDTANNSMYRIGDLGGYVIQEGDYIEWDVKLLKKVKGLGGIEINAVFLDSTKTETQDNKLLSELGYEGAKVDLTGSVGEWKKMSFPLKKTNAMVDAIWMAARVDAGAMDGTASVLYDNIVIKNKNGEVVKTVYVNQDEWLDNQKFIMRCEGGAEGADCQAYLVHTVYADKNGTVDVTLPEKEGERTIGYKISGQPKNGTLTLNGNKLTYVPGKDYTGMDGAILDYVFADVTDSVNPLKMKLNIAVDVDPEKVENGNGNGGGDKPTTGETLPLLAMAMLLPASAIAIFAVKKSKKRG